jgi:hypothetical protein
VKVLAFYRQTDIADFSSGGFFGAMHTVPSFLDDGVAVVDDLMTDPGPVSFM